MLEDQLVDVLSDLSDLPSAIVFASYGPWLPLGMAWGGARLFSRSSFQTYSF